MERTEKGENSRKLESTDEEKPLKKARYVWEVKGKHHLKNSSSGPHCKSSTPQDSSSICSSSKEDCSNPNKIQKLGQAVQTNCCLETFLAKTEDIIDNSDDSDEESQKLPLESVIENEIPVTLVSTQPKNQDYYLRKWQARQIARGFVDNTINMLLENWINRPFDAANFVEDCENDGQVEDDAILMAIQSHGLQSGWRGGLSTTNSVSKSNSNSSFSSYSNCGPTGSNSNESREETIAPVKLFSDSTYDNYENLQKEQENESSVASTSSSMSVGTASSSSNPFEGDLGDPMDFLNAAVSVAIQKKGLTYG